MLVPGANVDGVAIALNHHILNRRIGKGQKPIVFKDEVPVVVFAEQGVQGAKRDEALVPVGINAGHLQEGGSPDIDQANFDEIIEQPGKDNKPRKIGHVVICLDNSSSMNELSGLKDNSSKLAHIQSVINELIENGIPKDTACTLIVYSDSAKVWKGLSGSPLEFTTDLKTLLNSIRAIKPCGGTNFVSALDVTKRKINETHNKLGIDTNDSPPLFIFITDGEIDGNASLYGGKESIFPIARQIRDLNAHSLLIGTGDRYDEQFLRELTTELGPSMMVHTPHPNPTINVFSMFVSTFADDIRNEHYMSTYARGFFNPGKFFDMMPSIKNAPVDVDRTGAYYKIWTGYQKESTSVGFVRRHDLQNARLELCLQNCASGRAEHRLDIPIVDFDDAAPYFEYKEKAEDALARLLSFLSQREWDVDAFNQVVKDFPKSFSPDEIASISQILSQSQIARQSNYSRASLDDASTRFTTLTRADYGESIIDEQVNPFSVVQGDVPPSISGQPSGLSGRQEEGIHLHSGIVGPLNAPVNEDFHTIRGPEDVNAAAYDNVPAKKVNIEIIPIRGSIEIKEGFKLSKLNPIKIGRQVDNDLIASCRRVSKYHCQIIREGDTYCIQDSGSTNGTYVNGQRITQKTELKDGDLVHIGTVGFRISISK